MIWASSWCKNWLLYYVFIKLQIKVHFSNGNTIVTVRKNIIIPSLTVARCKNSGKP